MNDQNPHVSNSIATNLLTKHAGYTYRTETSASLCLVLTFLQGVSENTFTFILLPALVFTSAQTLSGARVNPPSLEIYIHRLSSPFELLPGS